VHIFIGQRGLSYTAHALHCRTVNRLRHGHWLVVHENGIEPVEFVCSVAATILAFAFLGVRNAHEVLMYAVGTRKEFTSFEAERAQSMEERHIIILPRLPGADRLPRAA
jgi:hypothetical protein